LQFELAKRWEKENGCKLTSKPYDDNQCATNEASHDTNPKCIDDGILAWSQAANQFVVYIVLL
jgi:hypothetical protein